VSVARFRKRPVIIEAVLWDGRNIQDVQELEAAEAKPLSGFRYIPHAGTLDIPTLEGTMTAQPGDWIIKGVAGEMYPCKDDIFDQTYEPVD